MNDRPMIVCDCGVLILRATPSQDGAVIGELLCDTEVIMFPNEGAHPYVLVVTQNQEGFVDMNYLKEA